MRSSLLENNNDLQTSGLIKIELPWYLGRVYVRNSSPLVI